MVNIKLTGLVWGILFLVACGQGPVVEAGPAVLATTAVTAEPAIAHTATATAPSTTSVPTSTTDVPDTAVRGGIVAGGRSIGDPYAPELGNTGYDVRHYTLQLTLDPALEYEIEGVATIDLVAALDNLGEVSLDFMGFDIDELLVDGQPADFRREAGKLIVTLPKLLASEEQFQIIVRYHGQTVQDPSPYVGFASWLGLFYERDNTIYILSEPDGARYWFPNNDHPRDKATYRFEITVPEGMTAVANGRLISQENNTFIWEHNYPMASYLATVAVGDYERIETLSPTGIPVRDYVFSDSRAEFEQATAASQAAIDWMGDLFGDYPYEEFGYVAVHAPGVSLETQTMVLLSTGMLDEQTAIHELAHMWFGDWVSLDSWGEMWRNEGFATYTSFLWEYRDDPEGLELQMEGIRAFLEDNDELGQPLRNPPPADLFSGYTYFGGALMIHELRREMGDDAFFAGLQTYFQQYGHGTASDEQFIAVMEAAAGKSLADFFNRWLGGGEDVIE